MTGVVKEIDADKGTVKVEVVVFGRPTPVEVPYSQLKR
jgi:transcription antitermination factor NusG